MKLNEDLLHSWDVSLKEAMAIQNRLRPRIVATDDFGELRYVAGVDVGFEDDYSVTRAAVVVLKFPELTLHEHAISRRPTSFEYVPGFLSFREIPAVLEALAKLETYPDLLLCDGQGMIHPRRMGIACHLGLLTDTPAIGVGKTHFIGSFDPVPDERGAWSPLTDDGEVIGAVVRTRAGTKPLYVSVGHRVSLETAIDLVLKCAPKYRLPETTRQAHNLASTAAGAAPPEE
ncbi:MAG TPA: deoxyribonuclease V [Herpetosiphonaceae bacterium]